ncbi:MAG: C-methyltransferase [Candidatus Brocadia sinica]|uniref:SAM-dependent methyltransferases n=1 Tax=Candidatus Brocadia sinica JPN1 TaxID=1197129 RepID=A0ABQ0K2Q9_9BACT|nr:MULTISPECIES: class I SAM-dependent methyltransferase [Brocadia]KXK25438.1 MAG: C-methyltransferase [Candidatus Brocadia sinica]MCK6468353.1 class I SAM-dependent methyltransferase [Candidatus Brocadia sinica]GAN35348.1 SAM-dependent methyltransferases [Candidatus Brocadia sinica JPN1]GIK12342.1 MAG: NDP-hexose methyltransferase [Candidatus Brocadia sinica]GJQ19582.1 MAG: NDP-hexose methyltransferase [Candidatus Brocadia sinica]
MKQSVQSKSAMPEVSVLEEVFCPCCNSKGVSVFYKQKNVPVHSVLLMPTREVAMSYPTGQIALGFCQNCGFIFNISFDPDVHEYSSRYEETQGFSSTFNAFHRRLAAYLIERYNLYNKTIIEVGCGKGEFLTMLCEMGENCGVGFDPGYINERNSSLAQDRITFIKDFYSEKHTGYHADFVCCKMTLEHIHRTADFVNTVRRSIGNRLDTIVFFQVPDVTRVLRELAFWDIYYEHCSYFSMGSLARLFRKCSFDVTDIWKDYGEQYLMIEARPCEGKQTSSLPREDDIKDLANDVAYFAKNYRNKLDTWKHYFQKIKHNKQRTVIWGSGSKGVAFLTTLCIQDEIEFAVDINPYKHDMYMPGTGQKIVGPDFLQTYKPDIVIAMNPIYGEEIRQDLNRMGLSAELVTV